MRQCLRPTFCRAPAKASSLRKSGNDRGDELSYLPVGGGGREVPVVYHTFIHSRRNSGLSFRNGVDKLL
jgi:hypothetical protein